ncbi:MAG: discoidin domain-containing protein [Clostridia bacterium]
MRDGPPLRRRGSLTAAPMMKPIPAWAMTDLGEIAASSESCSSPALLSMGITSQDFRIQVSDDGETWNTVKEVTGAASPAEDPYVIDLDRYAVGRYVRIYVTRRAANAEVTGINGPMVQLAEMGVWWPATVRRIRRINPALEAKPSPKPAKIPGKGICGEPRASAFRAALEQAQRILAELLCRPGGC